MIVDFLIVYDLCLLISKCKQSILPDSATTRVRPVRPQGQYKSLALGWTSAGTRFRRGVCRGFTWFLGLFLFNG